MIEYHKKIFNIFSISDDYIFSLETNLIKFTSNDIIKGLLTKLEIDYLEVHGNQLEVDLSNFKCELYENENDFLQLKNIKKRGSNILILSYEEKPISYIDDVTYVNFTQSNDNYFFLNSFSYYDFIDILKSKESEEEEAFNFIDYFNTDLRKIILTSLSDKSRTIIKYRKKVADFGTINNYSNGLELFKSCFTDNHQPKFLKNSLVKYANRFNSDVRFENVFKTLEEIVMSAKVNFEVYINNLSIDQIKRDYDDFKSKYFKELSDVLSKITNKIISLPIAVAGTLYAVNKIDAKNELFLYLIALIITLTSIYIFVLIKINFKDLNYINGVFIKDYGLLENNDFFNKFPEELKTFRSIKNRITNRISTLKFMSDFYYWILSLSNVFIIFLIFKKLDFKIQNVALFIIFAVILFGLIMFRNYLVNQKEDV